MDTAITVGSVLLVLIALVAGVRRLVLAGSVVARAHRRREKSGRSITRARAALTGVIATRVLGLALVLCAVTCWRLIELELGWPGTPEPNQSSMSPLRQLATDAARNAFASNGLVSLAVAVVADGQAEIVCLGARALAGREPVSDSTGFAAAIRTEILSPLGMHDTGIEPIDSSRPEMAQGYRGAIHVGPLVLARRAARVGAWTEPVLGAGAIVSSARDMLRYLQANMAGSGTPLHLAMQRSHRELFRSATAGSIGMLWAVPRGGGIIWHNGQTPGYSSYLGFSNDGRFGVAVLAGTRGYVPTELGVELLRQMRRHSTPG